MPRFRKGVGPPQRKKQPPPNPTGKNQYTGGGKPPQILLDLRAVYAGKAVKEETPGVMGLRTLLADNPKEFMFRLSRAEEQWRGGGATEAQGSEPTLAQAPLKGSLEDGEARVLSVIDELLREFEGDKS